VQLATQDLFQYPQLTLRISVLVLLTYMLVNLLLPMVPVYLCKLVMYQVKVLCMVENSSLLLDLALLVVMFPSEAVLVSVVLVVL